MPVFKRDDRILLSGLLTAVLLSQTFSLQAQSLPTQPFRSSGADLGSTWYSNPQYDMQSRQGFLKALESSLSHKVRIPNVTYVDDTQLNQYRDELLLHALDSRHLLIGTGTDGAFLAETYAQQLVQFFRDNLFELSRNPARTTDHVKGLAALALTDEALNILQLMQTYLSEVHLSLLRRDIDTALKHLQKIVQGMIPNAYVNGLVTPALIDLNATLTDILRGYPHSQKSIFHLPEIRKHIDRIVTSYNVVTPYPVMDIDPEKMINQSQPATSQPTNCWHWPWPVPGQATNYLICTE